MEFEGRQRSSGSDTREFLRNSAFPSCRAYRLQKKHSTRARNSILEAEKGGQGFSH